VFGFTFICSWNRIFRCHSKLSFCGRCFPEPSLPLTHTCKKYSLGVEGLLQHTHVPKTRKRNCDRNRGPLLQTCANQPEVSSLRSDPKKIANQEQIANQQDSTPKHSVLRDHIFGSEEDEEENGGFGHEDESPFGSTLVRRGVFVVLRDPFTGQQGERHWLVTGGFHPCCCWGFLQLVSVFLLCLLTCFLLAFRYSFLFPS
jgi:hypothetical protein